MDEIKKLFGEKVRKARKELGWSQADLAERFGCNQKTISNIERGVTEARTGPANWRNWPAM